MSSLNDNCADTACGTDSSSPAGTRPEKSHDQTAGAGAAPSYSAHVHLNYVTTLYGTDNRGEDRKVHQLRYSYGPATGTRSSVTQPHMSITCEIEGKVQNEELRLHIESSTSEAGLVSPPAPDCPAEKPAASDDALQSARERRAAALDAMFGIWKDRDDIPDGLEFQKAMRDEWR